MFKPQVLNKNQIEIVQKLGFLRKSGFYLAGGTGLALQLGHRSSIDFDFYTSGRIDASDLVKQLEKIFPYLKIQLQAENSLGLKINQVNLSFFRYDYPLINRLKNFQGVGIASVGDIAAMKMAAIVQRGTKRDFIDIFYLLQKYSLEKLIKFTLKKYPFYQEMIILRALIYFEDAEKEVKPRKIKIFDKNFSWEKAKKKIFEEVKKYQLAMIKK